MKFYGDYVILTDVLVMVGLDKNIMDIANNLLADQAVETKDVLARDHLVTGTSVRYANGVSARTDIVTELKDNDIEVVVNELERSNAKKIRGINTAGRGVGTTPIGATYIAITHMDNRKSIEALDGFVPVHEYPSRDALAEYKGEVVEIGSAKGIRFLATSHGKIWADGGGTAVTNNLKYTTANTACDVYGTLVFAKNAYGIIPLQKDTLKVFAKALGSAGTEDPLDQRSTVGYKFAHVAKILNEAWMWRIEHGAPSL
jgi:N4-gp56 family major capsid protein